MPYGYFTPSGYMGKVQDRMICFASERDYLEFIEVIDESLNRSGSEQNESYCDVELPWAG